MEGHLAARHRALFLAEGSRLCAAAANTLADRWPDRGALARLAAESDARYALLLDPHGEPLESRGASPDLTEIGRRPPLGAVPLAGKPPSYAFVQPVWKDGRRMGDLVWARWAGDLAAARRGERRALVLAYIWWAAAGLFIAYPWTRAVSRVK